MELEPTALAAAPAAAPATAAAVPASSEPPTAPLAADLGWDSLHHFNASGRYCYCGQDRTYGEPAVQCGECRQWFHTRCLSVPDAAALAPMQRNYEFSCLACVAARAADQTSAAERFEMVENNWRSIAETAVLNLALDETGRAFRLHEGGAGHTLRFSIRDEVIPWASARWPSVGRGRELAKILDKQGALEKVIFSAQLADTFEFVDRASVGLRHPERLPLGPLPHRGRAVGGKAARADDDGGVAAAAGAGAPKAGVAKKARRSVGAGAKRPEQRRAPRPQLAEASLAAALVPENSRMVAVSRCAELGSAAQDAGCVQLSLTHKASQLRVSKPPGQAAYLCAAGYKGYRTVCATHCVGVGAWYYEVRVLKGGDAAEGAEGHCRLGWATELASPDAPAGYDEHSYGYRSKGGTLFHESRGARSGGCGYGAGDVIGCLIHLPHKSTLPRWAARALRRAARAAPRRAAPLSPAPARPRAVACAPARRQRARLSLKNVQYLIVDPEQRRTPNVGSSLAFYRNGELQGVAFEDIAAEWWYPALSLFGSISLAANFGPRFEMVRRAHPRAQRLRPHSRNMRARARASRLVASQCDAPCARCARSVDVALPVARGSRLVCACRACVCALVSLCPFAPPPALAASEEPAGRRRLVPAHVRRGSGRTARRDGWTRRRRAGRRGGVHSLGPFLSR
jgi:Set1/Ash2 histone methyltransferase complex subunit ASH2